MALASMSRAVKVTGMSMSIRIKEALMRVFGGPHRSRNGKRSNMAELRTFTFIRKIAQSVYVFFQPF